ncbi:cell wall-binding repeat-containing protein [Clostridium sp. BSD9I1]|uniref:cell wall-binding repeat-containing protein n=1 Tax=Clostridium sp. BSD9I1 TaxID=2003589 RepID=UPI0016442B14|nr:cell wall-binding repeat-containing protein [Clostridium sp. BSD9I1]
MGFQTDTVTENVTLYAKWTANPTYTIRFDSQSGSAVGSLTNINSGEKITEPSAPIRTNYTFGGWYKESSCTNVWDFATDTVTGNVTLYAKWTVNSSGGGGGGGSSTSSSKTEQVTVNVTDGKSDNTVSKVVINRTTQADGTKMDEVKYTEDKAKETVDSLKKEGKDIARIVVPDAKDEVSETKVGVPKATISVIANGNISLEIDTENARITLPKESIKDLAEPGDGQIEEDLYFRVVPIKDAKQQEEIKQRAVQEEVVKKVSENDSIAVVGRPMTIETNMSNRSVDIELPLKGVTISTNPSEREAFLKSLGVFIEHSDGEKVLTRGEIVEYKNGTLGIKFRINKFSTFTIIKFNDSSADTTGVTRLAGENRVDTAIEIAKAAFKDKVKNVVIVNSENYPDGLTGSVFAYKNNAPMLLVGSSNSDPEKIISYMKDRMESNGTIFILGGTGVVSSAIEQKIKDSGFQTIKRISGMDRYETASKIAENLEIKEGSPVVIVSGENFPDALSVSSAAAVNQYPILLVAQNEIPDAIKKKLLELKPGKVFIIGLQGAISEAVENQISQLTALDKSNIVRIGGMDRFETSIEVAKKFNLSGSVGCVASGNNFPDALAGSIYAAKNNSPIILLDKVLSENQINYLKNKKASEIIIFGGEGVLNKALEKELGQILK